MTQERKTIDKKVFIESGKRGGEITKAKKGVEWYREIGRRGGLRGRGSVKKKIVPSEIVPAVV